MVDFKEEIKMALGFITFFLSGIIGIIGIFIFSVLASFSICFISWNFSGVDGLFRALLILLLWSVIPITTFIIYKKIK